MSLYQFFASDKPLLEYDNNIIGCDNKNRLIKKSKAKRKERFCITESDEMASIRIILEDDMFYAKMYTSKPYCAYIEWYYSDKNAVIITNYIQSHLKSAPNIELWNIWMGDKEIETRRKCNLDTLLVKDIKEIWGKTEFHNPECLEIFRPYYKGMR